MFNADDARKLSAKYVPTNDYLTKILRRIEIAAVEGRRSVGFDYITEYTIPDLRKQGFNVSVDADGVTVWW